MKKKGILILFPAILYLLFALLMALTISGKVDFYLDEYASYTLANRVANAPADFENYQEYTPAGDVFLKSIVADPARRFDYVSVFANQAADVHPPLYYILLHTICSFFPGTFSKWYAGVINIAFGLLTLFFVRKLARAMVGGTGVFSRVVVALLSVAFVFSAGVYNAVPFLRMYVMAMCWVTAFTFLLVDQIAKPHTRRFYLSVFAVAFLGAMTHYYCIVYTVFACVVYEVYLLAHKRWKETGLFTGTMALAGSVSVAVFPAMLQHMFFGYRGTDPYGTSLSGAFLTPDESMMLTGDLNIVDVEWIVQYRINDPRKYLFSIHDQETTIRDISQSVMNQLVGDLPILAIMTSERTNIEYEAQSAMQEIFDRYDSGIDIVAVKLQNIMPPEGEVQDAFEDVNKAIQDMNTLINEGKQYYNQEIPAAQGEADKIISEAEGYAAERINMAKGDTARFSAMLEEYEKDKETTSQRLYIETMEEVLDNGNGNITLIDKNLDNYLPLQMLGGSV